MTVIAVYVLHRNHCGATGSRPDQPYIQELVGTWYSPPVPADLSYVNVSDRRHPTTSRCHSYGLSLASAPFHTPDRQHGTLCRTAFAMNQTLQSFGNILKLTFSVQHLTFVNLLFIDFTQH